MNQLLRELAPMLERTGVPVPDLDAVAAAVEERWNADTASMDVTVQRNGEVRYTISRQSYVGM